ncbi:MAG: DUF2064 domain-containing protein [Proteobacteria bacterium]|nr:DUF2064 domain-containing protein [Pseudomonadota bacterium]
MTAVAIFVKTPGQSSIKTRLAEVIGKEKAESFYLLSCEWTFQTVKQLASSCNAHPFWAVAEREGMASSLWQNFDRVCQGEGSLGDRLHYVYSELLQRFGSVVVLGADSPELTIEAVQDAVQEVGEKEKTPFVIGETPDGGFYLFGGRKPIPAELWRSVSYSETSTALELKNKISELGVVKPLVSCADVDVIEDLKAVYGRLKKNRPHKYSELLALNLI